MNPKFYFEKLHKYDKIDEEFITNLLKNNLCYNVYGY